MLALFDRKRKPGINLKTPISDARYVVVDTELTGLEEKKDSIVSIGAMRMTGGRIELGDMFYRLVSPKTCLSADSVIIHEITPSDVCEQPGIDTVLSEFIDYCGNDVLVGHMISIDLSFLNREMRRMHGRKIANAALDTFSIYEWLRKRNMVANCAGNRLYDIIKCFDIPVHGAHNAIMDVFATAQLLQRFIPCFAKAGLQDIGDLLTVGKPFNGGDRFEITGEFSNF